MQYPGNLLISSLFITTDMVTKINTGKITKINVIPATKLELKLSKDSTNGNTETETKKCKIIQSNTLSKELEYGLKLWWTKATITQAVMSK